MKTRQRSSTFACLLVLLMLILACGGEASTPVAPPLKVTLPVAQEPLPPPTSAPELPTEPQPETFSDDFSTGKGWVENDTERYSAGRAEGNIYQMSFWQAGDNKTLVSLQPHQFGLPLRNMYIRAQGTALNANGAYGLICRGSDSQNYYTFHISTDGRFWLYRRVAGEWTNLGSGTSPAIREDNTIELQCIGQRLSASVNGMIVVEANDASLTEGNAGLFAQPLEGPLVGAWSYYAVFQFFEMTVMP